MSEATRWEQEQAKLAAERESAPKMCPWCGERKIDPDRTDGQFMYGCGTTWGDSHRRNPQWALDRSPWCRTIVKREGRARAEGEKAATGWIERAVKTIPTHRKWHAGDGEGMERVPVNEYRAAVLDAIRGEQSGAGEAQA